MMDEKTEFARLGMTFRPASQPASSIRLTMLPDPPENERDMLQFPHMAAANLALDGYFRHIVGRDDVLVGSEGYLCLRAGEARIRQLEEENRRLRAGE